MIQAFATSDIGVARELNEDYFYISYPDDKVNLFILADGMGGYNGGEIASKLAVDTAKSYILTNYDKTEKDDSSLLELIKSSSQYANMVVYEKAQSKEELKKMGTTLDICLVYQNKAYISHIGDSRAYMLRENLFEQITKDHSYVQQLLDEGKITEKESLNHPDKNMLMKALGVSSFVEPDVIVQELLNGDAILLCSDGLTNMVSDDEIYKIIKENPTDATKPLVQKANDCGGRDNITAVLLREHC